MSRCARTGSWKRGDRSLFKALAGRPVRHKSSPRMRVDGKKEGANARRSFKLEAFRSVPSAVNFDEEPRSVHGISTGPLPGSFTLLAIPSLEMPP